ncbi:MAG: prephenate dehydratase [Acidobacteriota bacterium]|nr:MAG: prephenate dehydratase [Acidobacteriota bacterium]
MVEDRKALQPLRVAFQGEPGAYSEIAALRYFGGGITTVPHGTFRRILDAVSNGEANRAILPVENSVEGTVGESYDLLLSTDLPAVGETYLRVRHCLLGFGEIERIKTVYSHPQALGQCRRFLEDRGLEAIPTYDTAGSAEKILENREAPIACIASKRVSELYDVPIILEGIEDHEGNATRFLILAKDETQSTGRDKTSIIFSTEHKPGSLYRILEIFNRYSVNLTKIESHPTRSTPWEYNFYVDFEGHVEDKEIGKMMEEVRKEAKFFKILGSYPKAERS